VLEARQCWVGGKAQRAKTRETENAKTGNVQGRAGKAIQAVTSSRNRPRPQKGIRGSGKIALGQASVAAERALNAVREKGATGFFCL